jgi:hypothetical protein
MVLGQRTVPSRPPSGDYIVMLRDHVDLPSFKENLPVHIHAKIVHEWSFATPFSGFVGTFFLWPFFFI